MEKATEYEVEFFSVDILWVPNILDLHNPNIKVILQCDTIYSAHTCPYGFIATWLLIIYLGAGSPASPHLI